MKNLLTIILLISGLLLAGNADAQFKWGIKGGVNFSSIKNFGQLIQTESLDSYTGWHAGFFLQIKIPILAIQADILYSQQGQQFTASPNSVSESFNLEQSYILIPVVAKFSLIPVLNLQAGVQYGILTTAAINGVKSYDFGPPIGDVSVADQFTSGDWSLVFGLGFDISKLMIDARYNLGVSDISDISLANLDPLKSGVIQLSAGIKF